ncbi:MAG TPA: hypothetical protein VFD59_02925, partial [Nocardioidaceae bacterium]|nr:hypothetical protein [Nocardioidaceae bacterium]
SVFLVVVPEFGREYEDFRLLGYGVALLLVLGLLPGGIASVGRVLADLVLRRSGSATPAVSGK